MDSYFSGCLTLTLERPPAEFNEDLVVLCDVPEPVQQHISDRTGKRIEHVSHIDFATKDREARFAQAERLLALYARASCVVTTRLHCALPCTAIGTPVLLLDTAPDQERFSGLNDFTRHTAVEEFLAGRVEFDVNRPAPNPDRHLPFRAALIDRARGFIDTARKHRRASGRSADPRRPAAHPGCHPEPSEPSVLGSRPPAGRAEPEVRSPRSDA